MDILLASQAETYKQLIKRSILLYRASFLKVLLLSLLLAMIIFIPRLLSGIIGQDIFLNLSPFNGYRLWLILINLVGLLFFIAILWNMHCTMRGMHEPWIEDIRVGIKKVVQVFIATLIQGAIIFSLCITFFGLRVVFMHHHPAFSDSLLGMPVITMIFIVQLVFILYISTLFVFLIPLIAIDNKNIFAAIEHSMSLVWNHWWRAFSVQLTPWVCYLLLLIVMKTVLRVDIHIYFTEYHPHSLWITLLHLIIFALFIPWAAALLLVQWKDLELRKQMAH